MMNMEDSLSSVLARLRMLREAQKERKMVEGKKRKQLDRWEESSDPKRRRTSRANAIGKDDDDDVSISTSKLVHPALLVLRLDAMGREIDDDGKVKVVDHIPKSLKVNINRQKKDAAHLKPPQLDAQFDPQMQGINTNKNRQPLLLLRRRPKLLLSVEESINLRQRRVMVITKEESSIPHVDVDVDFDVDFDVEWWDVPFLRLQRSGIDGGFSTEEENINNKMITTYVEHPRPIQPPAAAVLPTSQPLKLTKQERKKLRTQKRVARQKDIQQMIRLGVLEPPKPRLKISNMMKLGVGTQDPTKVEMEITRAAAEREQAHIDRNIARKLTPAERHQKKARKLFDDESNTFVSVYKISADLCQLPQARFKVYTNAQQNRLTGCAATIISDKGGGMSSSVVVVEGCNKSIKRFRKLMLERIDWTAATDEDENDENDDNKCELVWEGSVAKPNFSRFMVQGTTEAAARKFFSDNGVAHYLDLARNFDHQSHD